MHEIRSRILKFDQRYFHIFDGLHCFAPPTGSAPTTPLASRARHRSKPRNKRLRAGPRKVSLLKEIFRRIDARLQQPQPYIEPTPRLFVVWGRLEIDQLSDPNVFAFVGTPRLRFRLRSENFACEMRNFACEVKSFRKGPRKLLKSLAHEITDFAVSCDFKGLRPVLFRPRLFSVRAAGGRRLIVIIRINC
jgi:hypothetical protein